MNTPDLPRPHDDAWHLTRSHELLDRARQLVPGVTSSMMKRPEHFCPGAFPVFLRGGRGAIVHDVDGNEYVDFICGLGASSLGHQHPELVASLRACLESGVLHSLPTELELEVSEQLTRHIEGAEMVRFFKTGADATSAAIRLARSLSGKDEVITVGYNGWHDHFMYDTPGVPHAVAALTTRMPLFAESDEPALLDAVETRGGKLAAVVLSLPYNRQVSASFLKQVRAACSQHGVLFVLDEIVTGFRLAPAGASELFDVRPDIACYSKALAAGMPLSAITGSREILGHLEKLQVSTTFGGELMSLAACLAALRVYETSNYYDHIASLGRRLRDGVNRVAGELGSPLRIRGYDAIPMFNFAPTPEQHAAPMRSLQGHLAKSGVLVRRDVNFICASHTEAQIDHTIAAVGRGLERMARSGDTPADGD